MISISKPLHGAVGSTHCMLVNFTSQTDADCLEYSESSLLGAIGLGIQAEQLTSHQMRFHSHNETHDKHPLTASAF